MLIIPNELIDKFVSVSSQNVSKEDGKHLETLAFLAGIRQNGNLIGYDLIFPRQNCRPNSVEDQGKKAYRVRQRIRYLLVKFQKTCHYAKQVMANEISSHQIRR